MTLRVTRRRWWVLLALAALAGWLLLVFSGSRRVMARLSSMTMVGHQHAARPPWPDGNCFRAMRASWWSTLRSQFYETGWGRQVLSRSGIFPGRSSEWRVVNMHAENFRAISQRLNLKSVEIEILDDQFSLVVDRRIPREWMLLTAKSCCVPIALRQQLRRERPEYFREDAGLRALYGSTWVRVDREDAAGPLAPWVPGDRVRFDPAELTCTSDSGEVLAQRYWEPNPPRGSGGSELIIVYILDAQGFSGVGLEWVRAGDTLTLTPGHTWTGSSLGRTVEAWPKPEDGRPSNVRYRLLQIPSEHRSGPPPPGQRREVRPIP